jgi:hypothetical protein
VREVRGLLIQLERVLYGNELTEGLLPLDTLPQRVQKVRARAGMLALACLLRAQLRPAVPCSSS